MPEGVNLSHKLMRMRARPKILLCRTFEEAWELFGGYQENVLGVISDIEFPKDGVLARDAGVEFARRVRAAQPDVPIMLQSSVPENARSPRRSAPRSCSRARRRCCTSCAASWSRTSASATSSSGCPTGPRWRARRDLRALEELLATVPAESIAYHAERNHFSKWLKARTEFALAHQLRPRKVSDFPTRRGAARAI